MTLLLCFSNIDVKISLAEMEYSLEKDQIDMMNLSQKIQSARMENVKMSALKEISKQENHLVSFD